jgi:hypothetical protein
MSTITLADPNDTSVYGGMSNPDPIVWSAVAAGTQVNFTLDEYTSSEDVENLFNLTAPPDFLGPYMVWGQVDAQAGAMNLYLATTTGDSTYPFATLDGFVAAIDGSGGALTGSGTLTRSNKLPAAIQWTLNP